MAAIFRETLVGRPEKAVGNIGGEDGRNGKENIVLFQIGWT